MNVQAARLLMAIVLTLGVSFAALSVLGPHDNAQYGPLHCNACSISAPEADKPTKAFIERWIVARKIAVHDSFMGIGTGGRIIVCNSLACTTYRRTDSGDWHGIEQNPIKRFDPRKTPPSPDGIRGPDPVQRGGGGGSRGGSLRPDVTVGRPEQERKDRPRKQ